MCHVGNRSPLPQSGYLTALVRSPDRSSVTMICGMDCVLDTYIHVCTYIAMDTVLVSDYIYIFAGIEMDSLRDSDTSLC